jgi:hypothetical protein
LPDSDRRVLDPAYCILLTAVTSPSEGLAPPAFPEGLVKMSEKTKVVLAYSGGLDTSVILKWLGDHYDAEIVTFTADIGQGEELEPARAKAIKLGIPESNIFIEDLREEFVRDFVFPMFRANPVYEGEYLDCPAADRQAPDRDRARHRCSRGIAWRYRQGQRSGAFRARLLRAGAQHQGDCTMARVGSAVT